MAHPLPVVLYVVIRDQRIADVYGGERSILATAEMMAQRGYACRFLVTSTDKFVDELARRGMQYQALSLGNPLSNARGFGLLRRLDQLRRIIKINISVFREILKQGSNIVHSSEVVGVITTCLGARLAGAKTIYHIRDQNRQKKTSWYELLAVFFADAAVAVSPGLREVFIATAPAWSRTWLERRVQAICNGFQWQDFDALVPHFDRTAYRKKHGFSTATHVLLCVASIEPRKGQLRLIREILPRIHSVLPEVRCMFVGGIKNDAYYQECLEELKKRNLSAAVMFTGFLQAPEVFSWYLASDVGIMVSETEGLPRFAVEGQGFGLPIVSNMVTGAADIIIHGKTGFLLPEEKFAEIAERVLELLQDDHMRENFSAVSRADIRERFSLATHGKEMERLYLSLLKNAAR